MEIELFAWLVPGVQQELIRLTRSCSCRCRSRWIESGVMTVVVYANRVTHHQHRADLHDVSQVSSHGNAKVASHRNRPDATSLRFSDTPIRIWLESLEYSVKTVKVFLRLEVR